VNLSPGRPAASSTSTTAPATATVPTRVPYHARRDGVNRAAAAAAAVAAAAAAVCPMRVSLRGVVCVARRAGLVRGPRLHANHHAGAAHPRHSAGQQGLTLVYFSAQPEPFLTLNKFPKRIHTPSEPALNTP
jgi:hypothetical protein